MSSIALHRKSERVPQLSALEPTTLPARFGAGYGLYGTRKSSFVLSFIGHTLAIALFVASGRFVAARPHQIRQQVVHIVTDVSPYTLPPSASKAGGGGGGGDRDKLQASKGILPRFSRQQLAPPAVVIRSEKPRLSVEPTVVVPPEIHLPMPPTGSLGDPLSAVLGPPSNGSGSGGGIGSGSGGGVGSGHGLGVGPGRGGGIGGGVYRVGGGVTAPRVLYDPEPEFSDEARQAKYQGTVVLEVIVGTDGRTHDIRVVQALGMGLDEKAIEAVRQWRFEPGRNQGIAVAVLVDVEVDFHLF
jgi:periplasmic protein TonB